jgi:hypothetical protein
LPAFHFHFFVCAFISFVCRFLHFIDCFIIIAFDGSRASAAAAPFMPQLTLLIFAELDDIEAGRDTD